MAGDVLEPELGGEAGGCGFAGGAIGGSVLAGVGGVLVVDGSSGLGTEVQLYWNSGTVSSSPVRNLEISAVSKVVHSFCSVGVNCSKVALSLIKSCSAIFINGSRKLSAMPIINLVSTLLI
jgi:hypothetical protein